MAEAPLGYKKGAPEGSEEEWYHGELSRIEAEQALTASGCDCFLVRVSEGALILSLIHHGQLHHINIKYRLGFYELENSPNQYSFTHLDEMIFHYRENEIEGLKVALSQVCKKPNRTGARLQQNNSKLSRSTPDDLTKYHWFHGEMNDDQAETALRQYHSNDNGFLVRESAKTLILSKLVYGWPTHDIILQTSEGYKLDGKDRTFESVPELIKYYKNWPICGKQVLGTPIATGVSLERSSDHYATISFRKGDSSLKFSWKECASLPVAISTPQITKIGRCVYVGGGMTRGGDVSIYKYDVAQETWTPLPPCPTFHHALTTLNNELIAIGGEDKTGNKIFSSVFTFRSGEWVKVLPPMHTPRFFLSAVSYKNRFIIAAGGAILAKSNGEIVRTDEVEVYIDDKKAWYSTNPLPFPTCLFSMCIVNDTCYMLGSTPVSQKYEYRTAYTSVPVLLDNAGKQFCLPWNILPEDGHVCMSSPLELNGKLASMGGSLDPSERIGTRCISTYDMTNGTWVECKGARLPVPLYRAGVVKLDSDQVMIVGGQAKSQQFSAAVYIGRCSVTAT